MSVCLVALMGAVLAGCGGADDFSDLDADMNAMRLVPPGEIEPTPAIRSYPSFAYDAASLRSPFQRPLRIELTARQPGSSDVKPDPLRVKQFLEGFDIERFEMVGTLSNASGTFGLLRGASGVYRLKAGDYLGRNDGRIVAIGNSQVDVVEIVPDGAGAWLERPRTIPLKEHLQVELAK